MQISKKELAWIASMGLFIFLNFAFIWFLWQKVVLLAIILTALALTELAIIGSKKLAAVFVLAAVGAAFFESISAYLGIWSYNAPTFLNIPLWLIPGWGNAAIIITSFYKLTGKIRWLAQE